MRQTKEIKEISAEILEDESPEVRLEAIRHILGQDSAAVDELKLYAIFKLRNLCEKKEAYAPAKILSSQLFLSGRLSTFNLQENFPKALTLMTEAHQALKTDETLRQLLWTQYVVALYLQTGTNISSPAYLSSPTYLQTGTDISSLTMPGKGFVWKASSCTKNVIWVIKIYEHIYSFIEKNQAKLDIATTTASERENREKNLAWIEKFTALRDLYRQACYGLGFKIRYLHEPVSGYTAPALFKIAADLGYSGGQYEMGLVKESKGETEEAVALYKSSAENGYSEAAFKLFQHYRDKGDSIFAAKWCFRATGLGHPGAKAAFEKKEEGRESYKEIYERNKERCQPTSTGSGKPVCIFTGLPSLTSTPSDEEIPKQDEDSDTGSVVSALSEPKDEDNFDPSSVSALLKKPDERIAKSSSSSTTLSPKEKEEDFWEQLQKLPVAFGVSSSKLEYRSVREDQAIPTVLAESLFGQRVSFFAEEIPEEELNEAPKSEGKPSKRKKENTENTAKWQRIINGH